MVDVIQNDTSQSDSRERFFILRNRNNPTGGFSFGGNYYRVPLGDTHQDDLAKLWNISDPKELMAMAQHACAVLSGRHEGGSAIVVEQIYGRREPEKAKVEKPAPAALKPKTNASPVPPPPPTNAAKTNAGKTKKKEEAAK